MCIERYFYHSQSNVSVKIKNSQYGTGSRLSCFRTPTIFEFIFWQNFSLALDDQTNEALFSSVCIECLLLNRRNFCSFNNRINGAYSFRRYVYRETSQWVVNECRERFEMDFLSKLMRSKQQTSPEARSSVNEFNLIRWSKRPSYKLCCVTMKSIWSIVPKTVALFRIYKVYTFLSMRLSLTNRGFYFTLYFSRSSVRRFC